MGVRKVIGRTKIIISYAEEHAIMDTNGKSEEEKQK